jgi:hypothetical protein
MKRTTIFIDEQLEHDLRLLSGRTGRPVASLVREAMARYVSAETEGTTPSLGFEAAGHSGRTDIAEQHESLLWAGVHPHGIQPEAAVPSRKRAASRQPPGRASVPRPERKR